MLSSSEVVRKRERTKTVGKSPISNFEILFSLTDKIVTVTRGVYTVT